MVSRGVSGMAWMPAAAGTQQQRQQQWRRRGWLEGDTDSKVCCDVQIFMPVLERWWHEGPERGRWTTGGETRGRHTHTHTKEDTRASE